jgi:hypothetical protein
MVGNRFQLETAVWFTPDTKAVVAIHDKKQTKRRCFYLDADSIVEG